MRSKIDTHHYIIHTENEYGHVEFEHTSGQPNFTIDWRHYSNPRGTNGNAPGRPWLGCVRKGGSEGEIRWGLRRVRTDNALVVTAERSAPGTGGSSSIRWGLKEGSTDVVRGTPETHGQDTLITLHKDLEPNNLIMIHAKDSVVRIYRHHTGTGEDHLGSGGHVADVQPPPGANGNMHGWPWPDGSVLTIHRHLLHPTQKNDMIISFVAVALWIVSPDYEVPTVSRDP